MLRLRGVPAMATHNLHCKVGNLFPFPKMFSYKKSQTSIVCDYFVGWG